MVIFLIRTITKVGQKGQWFIRALGFNPEKPEHLKMLEDQIRFNPDLVIFVKETKWGSRFKQELSVTGPKGKIIKGIRSHWQKDKYSGIITLVTLLPPKKSGNEYV